MWKVCAPLHCECRWVGNVPAGSPEKNTALAAGSGGGGASVGGGGGASAGADGGAVGDGAGDGEGEGEGEGEGDAEGGAVGGVARAAVETPAWPHAHSPTTTKETRILTMKGSTDRVTRPAIR